MFIVESMHMISLWPKILQKRCSSDCGILYGETIFGFLHDLRRIIKAGVKNAEKEGKKIQVILALVLQMGESG